MANILILDRDPLDMARHAHAGRSMGHVVELVADCGEACRLTERHRPDAIVVGRLAGDVFRDDLCSQLRQIAPAGQSAIVALVPASARLTRIRCLEEGADGVFDDTIAPGALWSRIEGLVSSRNSPSDRGRLSYGPIKMDVGGHKVAAAGLLLALNRTSFSILRLFLENPERILARPEISTALGRGGLHRERTIDVHIRTLRLAMKPGGADELIVTVPQAGYMLCDRSTCDCRAATAVSEAVAR